MSKQASTKVRFLAKTANGAVHAVGAGAECPIVKKGAREGTWKGMRSIPPAKVLDRKDCQRCDTHARAEAALNGTTYGAKREPEPTKTVKKTAKSAPKKTTEVRMTQAGPRSVGGDSEDKAKQLLEFAKEHGWKGKVNLTGTNQASIRVTKGNETIVVNFIDGKYDVSNQATIVVGDWTGVLRGAHRARKQMSLEGKDRPYPTPGKGGRKRSPKADADSGEESDDIERVVPWSADSKDEDIIEAIKGKVIEWRNRTSGAIDRAEVADKGGNVKIEPHPREPLARMVSFAQVLYDDKGRAELGGERVVRIDRIINVRPA